MNNWKKTFVTIYIGQAFSLLGSSAVQFAVIWWLTAYTESAIVLTLSTVISFLPNILFGAFAGVWVDRHNRKTIMIIADSLVALSSIAMGVVFWFYQTPPIWLIFSLLFIRGIGNTFHTPAMQAAIPLFVPTELLTKAGGWGNLITSVSTMLGPALGAGMLAVLPIAPIMLVDIIGAFFAVMCLLMVSIPDIPKSQETQHIIFDIRQGVGAVKKNQPLAAIFLPIIFVTIFYMPLGSLFPLLVRLHYMGNAGHNAFVQIVFSAGLLVSSTVMGVWGGTKNRFLMISTAICVLGLGAFCGGILPQEEFIGFVFCCLIMGASGTFFNVPLVALIQETVEPQMMGKVFSLLSTAMTLATPFGLLIAGPISEKVGIEYWFAASGLLIMAIGIYCFFSTRKYN